MKEKLKALEIFYSCYGVNKESNTPNPKALAIEQSKVVTEYIMREASENKSQDERYEIINYYLRVIEELNEMKTKVKE